MKVPRDFDIFWPSTVRKPWAKTALGLGVLAPEVVEIEFVPGAHVSEARHVADGRVEPDVEVLARGIGNLEAEVGRVARDVPVPETGVEPFVEFVRYLRLHVSRRGDFRE